jgi:hypothetical protein
MDKDILTGPGEMMPSVEELKKMAEDNEARHIDKIVKLTKELHERKKARIAGAFDEEKGLQKEKEDFEKTLSSQGRELMCILDFMDTHKAKMENLNPFLIEAMSRVKKEE